MKSRKASHYVVFIAAQIHSSACFDMLRYDSCCPASEQESARLDHAIRTGEAGWVIFKRFVIAGGKPEPTIDRWKSFNIPVSLAFEDCYAVEDWLKQRSLRS